MGTFSIHAALKPLAIGLLLAACALPAQTFAAAMNEGINSVGAGDLPISVQNTEVMRLAPGTANVTGTVRTTGDVEIGGGSPINAAKANMLQSLMIVPCGPGQAVTKTSATTFGCISLAGTNVAIDVPIPVCAGNQALQFTGSGYTCTTITMPPSPSYCMGSQVLQFNGSNFVCTTLPSTATGTMVSPGSVTVNSACQYDINFTWSDGRGVTTWTPGHIYEGMGGGMQDYGFNWFPSNPNCVIVTGPACMPVNWMRMRCP
jgi:hypothetical protein